LKSPLYTLANPVFSILQRGGKVYTEIVPGCARKTLQAIICGKVEPVSIIHSEASRGYSGLVDLGYKKPRRTVHRWQGRMMDNVTVK
jgi:transposase-like protein